MSKPEDPFYTIRDEVRTQAEQIKIRHERFQDLVNTCDTYSSQEFKELRKGLVKDVRSADKKIKGLKDAVEMIDKNRARFEHIKDVELASRKKFVDDMQNVLNNVKTGMESSSVRRKMEDDENRSKRESFENNTGGLSRGSGAIEKENEAFIKDQRQQAKVMIAQQDEQLGHLSSAVDRLDEIGRQVNTELKEQNVLLDGLESDLDDADKKMNTVMAALSKLLKTKDGCQIWTIVILALILIILVALVIWT